MTNLQKLENTMQPQMIWVLSETVLRAVEAMRNHVKENKKIPHLHNNETLEAAAEILWKAFKGMSAHTKSAVIKVYEETVAYDYFNADDCFTLFVKHYENINGNIEIRVFA